MTIRTQRWQFWIDRGGTFTDVVGRSSSGQFVSHKLLSENPDRYHDAALQGIREILKSHVDNSFGLEIEAVKMGTTVGTNALLERKGEPTALLITAGLKDCLRIGYQNRPDIFALNIRLPEQLYQCVLEINERINARGEVLQPLDIEQARRQLNTIKDKGIDSLAIVLMHAWRYPLHELQLAELADGLGFNQISISHRVSPLMKIVSRGDTTVVDAYLSPLLKRYVHQVDSGLNAQAGKPTTRLMFMQSNGGLIAAEKFQGKDSILSGPAGGIVGAVATSKKAGFERIIAFDMGGTSTDVAHFGGELERSFETEVAGIRMRAPMMKIHTIAAGGGSKLYFDGMRYQVGPDSAGANPGPASYRRGGPLTVTDANVMLGKLPLFPALFGPQANLSLDSERVSQLFNVLAGRIKNETGNDRTPEQVAEGFLMVAVENMATAIKKISVQRGYNVSAYTLSCYGAAGGQHACKVADRLGMRRILIHPFAGVLSAYGMGLADFRLIKEQALEWSWDEIVIGALNKTLLALEKVGRQEMTEQAVATEHIDARLSVFIRYLGTDTALQIDFADKATMQQAFENKYRRQFGFIYQNKPLVVEKAAVEVIGITDVGEQQNRAGKSAQLVEPVQISRLFSNNAFHECPVYHREDLVSESVIPGPAIIIEPTSTTVIEPDWQGEITAARDLILTRVEPLLHLAAIGTSVDPVMLEIFNKLFMSIAEQMGFVLQNTAYSVNIKERLDFSCAIFDDQARLIANAPHIPVHLGSMGESVQALLIAEQNSIHSGDVYLLNSPYQGGTHLPDITVVTPVFAKDEKSLLFLVASRGHHADVGGITPGSMPADSWHIEQEGVISSGLKIVKNGEFQEQDVLNWLTSGKFPARNPEQNAADLQAQIAANEKGVQELAHMVDSYSLKTVQAYMRHVRNNAAAMVHKVLHKLSGGRFAYALDEGAEIVVKVDVDNKQGKAVIDFTGTSKQLDSNFNAPAAICKAAVLYVFRTLVENDIPLNDGCLQPLQLIIPDGCMLNPKFPAPVVAGNVETSQYIVDALYGALGVLAASQGTMNNFTFGNERYQYYETICGGAGAGAGFSGADAVHTHMTNSRMTDPEILEWRFPVVLEEFSIRLGSGGEGRYQGGNGVLRRIRFLESMTAAIVSSHRKFPPFGIKGGSSGKTGVNTVITKDGRYESIPACAQIAIDVGDQIQIETPGGGGYGVPKSKSDPLVG